MALVETIFSDLHWNGYIAIVALLFSIWLFMKLAGKNFNMGIMMYGKNARPQEIWKSMWA